jgi:hypothetical protein
LISRQNALQPACAASRLPACLPLPARCCSALAAAPRARRPLCADQGACACRDLRERLQKQAQERLKAAVDAEDFQRARIYFAEQRARQAALQ